jgi:hypothetical protein
VPLDLEILIRRFTFGPLPMLEEGPSGTCQALAAGRDVVDFFVMRMADAPPPRSALVVEIVRVMGLLEPKDVSICEDLSEGVVVVEAGFGVVVEGDVARVGILDGFCCCVTSDDAVAD